MAPTLRGPGKKENYNLDYSRFNYLDNDEAAEPKITLTSKAKEAQAGAAQSPEDESEMPDMAQVLSSMPPELREAYRLMAVSKQTGDDNAHKRATELALAAIERGGPKVKEDFIKNVAAKDARLGELLAEDMAGGDEKISPDKIMERLTQKATEDAAKQSPEPMETRIDNLRSTMEEGQKATRKQLEAMQQQQDELERMKSPEDIMKFMASGGLGQEDFQRMFSGDGAFMEETFRKMIDKNSGTSDADLGSAEESVKAAEVLHGTLTGQMDEITGKAILSGTEVAATSSSATADKKEMKTRARTPEPQGRQVTIPDYRLQYSKDDDGRYTNVELKCTLPGVADMSMIVLDVSADHLRLNTLEPAPGYVVNAGPFPVPIDPSAARAKYSKRRQELSISVPTKS